MGSSKKRKLTFSFSNIPTPNPYHQHEARRPSKAAAQKKNKTSPTRDGSSLFELSDETDVSHAMAHGEQPATDPVQGQPHPKGPRYTYRDHKGILREIWQPGDPDGQRDSEFPDNPIYTCRWRFFQSDVDLVKHCSWPPKCVILDDKAAHAVISSGAYNRKERRKYWPFDFNYHGDIRVSRPNRGRPAIVDEGESEGDKLDLGNNRGEMFIGWCVMGENASDGKRYHFTGERTGWTEITFKPYATSKKTAKVDEPENRTPDEIAKRQAEDEYLKNKPVMNPRHKRQKIGPYLHSTPSPEWSVRDRSRQAYASKNRYRAFEEEEEDNDGLTGGAEESPRVDAESKTRYAGMDISTFPERIEGRIVRSRIQTGAQIPRVGAGDNSRALWQGVEDMETELIQAREKLSLHDQEISELKKKLEVQEKQNKGRRVILKARDDEIEQLKAELKRIRKR